MFKQQIQYCAVLHLFCILYLSRISLASLSCISFASSLLLFRDPHPGQELASSSFYDTIKVEKIANFRKVFNSNASNLQGPQTFEVKCSTRKSESLKVASRYPLFKDTPCSKIPPAQKYGARTRYQRYQRYQRASELEEIDFPIDRFAFCPVDSIWILCVYTVYKVCIHASVRSGSV